MDTLKGLGLLALKVFVIFLMVRCTATVWEDCRKDHGFLYCAKVLSK